MQNKKIVLFFVFVLFSAFIYAKEITYSFVCTDGSVIEYKADDTEEGLTFHETKKNIKTIKGLDQFNNLISLELFRFKIDSYDFLKDVSSITAIYTPQTPIPSLDVLYSLENLEYIFLENGFYNDYEEYITNGGLLDLTPFTKLKKITFEPKKRPHSVPNFKVDKSGISLILKFTNIEKFSEEDIRILKQFDSVDISFSPVCKNEKELKRLTDNHITYTAKKPKF